MLDKNYLTYHHVIRQIPFAILLSLLFWQFTSDQFLNDNLVLVTLLCCFITYNTHLVIVQSTNRVILMGTYFIVLIIGSMRSWNNGGNFNLEIGSMIMATLETGTVKSFVSNILFNILIAIPLPILIHLHTRKWLIPSLLTFPIIELIQLLTRSGVFDVDDIILNMLGVSFGILIITINKGSKNLYLSTFINY